MKKKLLYIGNGSRMRMPTEGPFVDALREIGDLTIIRNGDELSDAERAALIRDCNILLTMWGSAPIPVEIASNRGKLEYVCNITGEMRGWMPQEVIEAGIPVTNWGDAPADGVAEAAMAMLLAVLKDIHKQIQNVRNDGWYPRPDQRLGTIKGLNVGIYGLGVIGLRFMDLIRPFGPVLRVFDPFIKQLPEGCTRVDSLDDLFRQSQAIVIHAGLTEQTRHSVNAERLAMLPDQGIIINTARGGIVDQEALFAELERGRLRAGLDVLDGTDSLEPGHRARTWDNAIFTAHSLSTNNWNIPRLERYHEICLENLQRHINGEPLKFVMTLERFKLST